MGKAKMKVLVLTCSMGGGHNACAKYIKEEFVDNDIECDVKDFLDIAGKKTSDIVEKMYLDSTKGHGSVFKGIYKLGELYSKTIIPSPVYGLNKLVKNKLYKYIVDNEYDIVLGTHLFPCMTMTEINKKHKIPFINVATDYECIPFWEETKPDWFVIPSEKLEDGFIKKGFKKDKLLPFGIPVSSRFKNANNTSLLPKDANTVMIVSGSMGFGDVKKLVVELLDNISNTYFLVICGRNKKLKDELDKINNKYLIVKGYTTNMNEYMKESCLVVTKPGGLTTSEVVTMRKPLVHMMPIPGVENYNANFFLKEKMSLSGNTINEVVKCVKILLDDELLQNDMINNQKRVINDSSASDLVKFVLDHYGKDK